MISKMPLKYKETHYYIYKIISLIKDKPYYYIGKRISHYKSFDDDPYYGSGIIITRLIKKYGRENFKKEVLEEVYNKEDLTKREREIVNEALLNDEWCINLAVGGSGHRKYYKYGADNPAYGKHHTKEHNQKISTSLKNHKVTEETRRRQSEARINYVKTVNSSFITNKKMMWKGNQTKYVAEDEIEKYLNNGWTLGMSELGKIARKTQKKNKGHNIISKDNIIKRVMPDELEKYLNDGWKLGFVNTERSFKKTKEENKKQSDARTNSILLYNQSLDKHKYIKLENVNDYLNDGWIIKSEPGRIKYYRYINNDKS